MSRIKNDLINFLDEHLEDMAENNIECWKDRYYRYSKGDLEFDLRVNADNSSEVEYVEDELGRKLSDKERDYVIEEFIQKTVEVY